MPQILEAGLEPAISSLALFIGPREHLTHRLLSKATSDFSLMEGVHLFLVGDTWAEWPTLRPARR